MGATLSRGGEDGPHITAFLMVVNLGVLAFGVWTLVVDTIPTLIEEYQMKIEQTLAIMRMIKSKFKKVDFAGQHGFNKLAESKDEAVIGVAVAAPAAAAAAASAGAETRDALSEALSMAELDAVIRQLFERYDLDNTTTLNNNE